MNRYPFTISLNPNIQVNTTEDGYSLSTSASEEKDQPLASMLTLSSAPGMGDALTHLREGYANTSALIQTLVKRQGATVGEHLAIALQQLEERGWLNYAVLPLAVAIPMVETAKLNLNAPPSTQQKVSLSRFAYQHSYEGTMVLESPLSQFRVKLLDWRASAILAQLAQPQALAQLTPPPYVGAETAYQFLNLLWAADFLTVDAESVSLQLWDFHNLLFHARSRLGRHDYPTADIKPCIEQWSDFPVVKALRSDTIISLPRPNLEVLMLHDATLTAAIETRESIREYDEAHPITIEQLGELLYRTARVKEIYTIEKIDTDALKAQFGLDFELGTLSRRPYPCGGAMYELEVYPVVRRCEGLNSGLYHYDPLNHQLAKLDAKDSEIAALISDAHLSSGEQGVPQVLLVITARFGRLFRKYRSLAYALVLKHVGVLHQNLYLVATNMGLAPCSLGAGDSDCFAKATGLDYIEESSVGEFMLGSLPNRNVEASEIELVVDDTPSHDQVETFAFSKSTQPVEITADEAKSDAVLSSQVEVPALNVPVALYPHDLDNRIPGLADLRNRTLGDPRLTIVILDGNPDHTLSCFQGAEISKVFPYWHEKAAPISVDDYATYRKINNSDLKGEEKADALFAAFPEPLLKRILGDNHACHITSTIVGQESTPSPGLAPHCRVINVPLNTAGADEEFISVLNLARAFELAINLGANLIHCAACRPTQTGEGEELLNQAIKKCQDNNILIVAPAGNNKGECWCMPAVLPGTLAVGAMKEDGTPYKFSNWGGNYEVEGIMAPGGDILGAQPATEEPIRLQGTSMAAPVVTGLCALLMSLQLQEGKLIDAEAIRAALLNTAIPCNSEVVDEPERCLRGFINLPGAMSLLFGKPSITISFVGEQITRTERTGYANFQPTVANTAIPAIVPAKEKGASIVPSTAHSGHVYALGILGYDFGDEARRDTFTQRMVPTELNGIIIPPDPYDARQMVEHLDRNPDESRSLIWTLSLDQDTIYVLEPKGAFADDIYEMFLLMLAGQLEPETSDNFIERISVPARRTDGTVELFSGEVVPVVTLPNVRGMYGWRVNTLVDVALAKIPVGAEQETLRQELTGFLNRVYHDLRNVGQTSRDRALNFAATNIFQAASAFVEAISKGLQLDIIEVEKSPFCRLNSDCWDIKLTFSNPGSSSQASKVFLFTIDVSDLVPVTIGEVKSWSIAK